MLRIGLRAVLCLILRLEKPLALAGGVRVFSDAGSEAPLFLKAPPWGYRSRSYFIIAGSTILVTNIKQGPRKLCDLSFDYVKSAQLAG